MGYRIFLDGNFSENEQGSALVIALVMLVVLTMMAIAGMQTTSIQERMAGNLRDKNLAFQSAEAALREAEMFLQAAVLPSFNGTAGLYSSTSFDRSNWTDPDFWSSSENYYEYEVGIEEVTALPQYIIEELPVATDEVPSLAADEPIPDSAIYRITAKGFGGTKGTEVILQTMYKR
jgi:type IV pilus assembly protein PilX